MIKNEIIRLFFEKSKSKLIPAYNMIQTWLLIRKQGKLHILNRVQSVEEICKKNMSISRFGDGEFEIIWNHSIGFQNQNSEMQKRLVEVLEEGTKLNNLLICIPGVLNSLKNLKTEPKQYWMNWMLSNRYKLMSILKSNYVYGDSLLSRLYLPWKNKSNEQVILEGIKSVWSNKKIVIVEGEKTRFGVGNDLMSNAREINRILCPKENAFSSYEEILDACIVAKKMGAELFILALGPTATILAYDLAKLNIQSLDLGHIDLQYEYLCRKSCERIAIAGKYNNEMNEVSGKKEVEEIENPEYIDSIIVKIGIEN